MRTQIDCSRHRILVDAAQTPSVKTKIAELKFVTNLATTYCRSDEFPKHASSSKAVQKIVQLANDQKSVELRSQARLALIALYNCNTPEVRTDQENGDYRRLAASIPGKITNIFRFFFVLFHADDSYSQ